MEKLRRIAGNGRVDSMLDGLQNDKWANAFFRGKRYGEMSSNAAESYNNWIGGARELPVTCMVDMIRVQIMTQLSDRRAESRRWTTKLCPVMEKKLVDSLELAKSWDVIVASDTVLEIVLESHTRNLFIQCLQVRDLTLMVPVVRLSNLL
ncbi:uncharacterized protein LOC114274870 [Camellia sinensis]|uniref:uncharacterized protein LOC114274870 n=1 Tax=Camellia sinensis TaxID=4442 RepID=UPI0010357B2E|nr:uncharacterized protein LOC114274870 [Camellia sinensis]